MPLFDFVCRACGERFEALVTGSFVPSCPKCQSFELQKLLSAFALRTGRDEGAAAGSRCSGCAGTNCAACH
jgi:putative FmdB family regulatory protein